jgi:hypothetical protein
MGLVIQWYRLCSNTATLDLAGNGTTPQDQNLGVVYAINPSLHLDTN